MIGAKSVPALPNRYSTPRSASRPRKAVATLSALRAGNGLLLFLLHRLRRESHALGDRDRYAEASAGGPAVDRIRLQRSHQHAAHADFRRLEIEIDVAALIAVRHHHALDGDRLAGIGKAHLLGPHEEIDRVAG